MAAATCNIDDAILPSQSPFAFWSGVASDIIARVVFEQVGKQVGQTFVIENRPGAGGTIGANTVAKAAPDGHTILVYGSIAAANALYARLPYDTVADFTPVVPFG